MPQNFTQLTCKAEKFTPQTPWLLTENVHCSDTWYSIPLILRVTNGQTLLQGMKENVRHQPLKGGSLHIIFTNIFYKLLLGSAAIPVQIKKISVTKHIRT